MAAVRVASEQYMEREANYAAVGAFVLLILALAGTFVYWYTDSSEARSYQRHEIYFDGSVSGLTVGSTVRYLGVDVGRVVAMHIDKRSTVRVQVIVDIVSDAPVSEKTVAELSLLGVTGLLYIDLLNNAGTKKLATLVPTENYPVIRSVRSSFDTLISGMPELMGQTSDVAQKLTVLLSEENILTIRNTLLNLEKSSRTLPETMQEVNFLAKDLRLMSRDMREVSSALRLVTEESAPKIHDTVKRINNVAENLSKTSERLDNFVINNAGQITQFTKNGLPEIEKLVRQSTQAAIELQSLTRSLRDNPSQLIYHPAVRGVEVPR